MRRDILDSTDSQRYFVPSYDKTKLDTILINPNKLKEENKYKIVIFCNNTLV